MNETYCTPYGRDPRVVVTTVCPTCDGSGYCGYVDEDEMIREDACVDCNGTGRITSEVPLEDVFEWGLDLKGLLPAFFEWLAMQSPSSLPGPFPTSGVQGQTCTPSPSCSSNGGVQ